MLRSRPVTASLASSSASCARLRSSGAEYAYGRRCPSHVTGALPDLRQFAQLLAIGDEDEVPRLPVL
jgi:hypothetical protein